VATVHADSGSIFYVEDSIVQEWRRTHPPKTEAKAATARTFSARPAACKFSVAAIDDLVERRRRHDLTEQNCGAAVARFAASLKLPNRK